MLSSLNIYDVMKMIILLENLYTKSFVISITMAMIVLIAPLVASSPLGLSTGLLPRYLQQDLFIRSKLLNKQMNMINDTKRHQMSND